MTSNLSISDVKIVRIVGRSTLFAVRTVMSNGDEADVYVAPTRSWAEVVKSRYERILASGNGYIGAIAVSTLIDVKDFAARIAKSSDNQGEAAYATKAHMRAWGEQIAALCEATLSETGLFAPPPKTEADNIEDTLA